MDFQAYRGYKNKHKAWIKRKYGIYIVYIAWIAEEDTDEAMFCNTRLLGETTIPVLF